MFFTLIVLTIGISCTSAIKPAEDTLQLVHVLFRHGDRTPDAHEMYPNDIYNEIDFQPMGFGQLTNRGKQRSYLLGKLLRERYGNFLGDIYTSDIMEMISTDFDRTKMSALLVLAGLFPPSSSQKWNDELNWLPIPYDFDKAMQDYFIRRATHYCPKYLQELKKVEQTEEYNRILQQYADVINYLQKHSGKRIKTFHDAFSIYQTLHAEENMNFTLPEWTKTVYPKILGAIAAKQCQIENSNALLTRLNGGRVLKKVIEHIKSKIDGSLIPNKRKIFLYSGHENNVINILAALGVIKSHVVEFSSATIIELHYLEDLNDYTIKVVFVKSVYEEPITESINGCKTPCLIKNFLDVTKIHIPTNYTKECESDLYIGE